MNYVHLSPHFPPNYYLFAVHLNRLVRLTPRSQAAFDRRTCHKATTPVLIGPGVV